MLTTLNIVSNLATPHNNSLVQALRELPEYRVVTWYAQKTNATLPWESPLGGEHDNHYFDSWLATVNLICRAIICRDEHFLLVGHSNFAARAIFIAFFCLRRRLLYWTDHPEDADLSFAHRMQRRLAETAVAACASHIFVVGRHTVHRFHNRGFSKEKVFNLPIFIDIPIVNLEQHPSRQPVRRRFGILDGEVFFVAASRLVKSKGYDVLIRAAAIIDRAHLSRFKLCIVGSGPEESRLKALVNDCCLENRIIFESWLPADDYQDVISGADVFVHPARFDAFGGGTLYAMALGIPVIGSDGAGAARERIISGENGLLYSRNDETALAACIIRLMDNKSERAMMGRRARHTAELWPPSLGAKIVHDALRGSLE